MPSPTPTVALAQRIVNEVATLAQLEKDLLANGNQELANIVRLAYLEFQTPAVTGFLNRVNVDSRSVRGAI